MLAAVGGLSGWLRAAGVTAPAAALLAGDSPSWPSHRVFYLATLDGIAFVDRFRESVLRRSCSAP
jgi:hypothetical protein